LYKFIEEKDKEVAHKIGLNNRKRLLRAYEILSEGKSLTKTNEKIYDYLIVFCEMDREKLYDKINNNVDRMLANGWVNEVNQLYKTYGDKLKSLNAFTAIGYRDILDSICNGITLDVDKIKTDTRHYAKRQLTWIKNKYDNLIVFNQENYEEVVGKVEEFLK
jgi:tRNA dimethylallyltransferase